MARKKQPKSSIDFRRPWVECFILCDYARSENRKLYIVGGGWNDIVPKHLPLEYQAYLAIKAILPWQTMAKLATIRIELVDLEGRVLGDPILQADLPAEIVPQDELAEAEAEEDTLVATLFMTPSITMSLTAPGRFMLRLLVNDETIAATSFVVTEPALDVEPGPAKP